MKIGLVIYGSLDEQSGGFQYDRRLVSELRAAGETVDVIELPWRSYPRGLVDNVTPGFARRLAGDYDVLLQDELAHPSLAWTNRRLSTPIVSIVHHLRASEHRRLQPLYRAVERRYLRGVDGVVCNSSVTRDVVTDLAIDAERTVIAPPAGDRFDPAITDDQIAERARDNPLRLLFVGNITPRKGLATLIDGLAAADSNAELTVVGQPVDEAYVARCRDRVVDRGLADRVEFTGAISDDALAAEFRDHHVLAVPSQYEGYGLVYLEGMSFGLPAIAARAGGATDLVTDGDNGFLVEPDDSAAVADAITTLAADRERLAAMGQAARQRYDAQPDWTETASRVRQLLTDVVAAAKES
ncbi:glycosyltransferase family 1 protein [Halonotius terrestris]|uniref:Glycosyltransferase family 1 protein n=1 Tax=Halonotius terrestris TaxID=2487750 RepID=A0A8J8P6Y3_9EURY|nr:glycosyltransferase family 4 protein [Halonotius terrestris]TQQ80033.1 glycosyltransferase family 1 protein [Halonotius terrestris]